MRKFWIYLAMPVALLNGCQRQQAALEEAENLAVESSQETSSVEENSENEQENDVTLKESLENETTTDNENETDINHRETGPIFLGNRTEAETNSISENPPNPLANQHSIREAPFHGATVSIIQSEKEKASEITEEEIEAMVREVAADLNTVVQNGQTVVI